MKQRALGVVFAVLALSGCQSAAPAASPSGRGHATPALTGYRAKTPEGVDLIFDAKRALYAVPSVPGAYWVDQRYFRPTGATETPWETSPALDGPWIACAPADLPAGLR